MKKVKLDSWSEKLNMFLCEEGIVDSQFYDFMRSKITKLPLKVEEFGWGVFPITSDEGVLVDIRMIVPIMYDVKSLCVNIHEYTHAYEVYCSLGKVYVWQVEESEQRAREAEKRYLKSINIE